MTILKRLHAVPSGDGKKRYRAVWGHQKFSYFFTREELVELLQQGFALLKGEPHPEWDSLNSTETLDENQNTESSIKKLEKKSKKMESNG